MWSSATATWGKTKWWGALHVHSTSGSQSQEKEPKEEEKDLAFSQEGIAMQGEAQ